MPSPSTILTSGVASAIAIAGLTFLADVSTRAQLDRALQAARMVHTPAIAASGTVTGKGPPSALDRRRLEATVLMISQPGDE